MVIINASIMYFRAKSKYKDKQEALSFVRKASIFIVTVFPIPFIILSLGQYLGKIDSIELVFDHFRSNNLYIILFHISILIIHFFLLLWICLMGGAERIISLPEIFHSTFKNPRGLKIFTLALGIILLASLYLIPKP